MSRRIVSIVGALSLALLPCRARADVPPASSGFQLAFRTGAAVPLGNVSATTSMSDALGVQAPFIVDVGWKPGPRLFVGAFFGVAVGGAAGQIQSACEQLGVNCVGLGFRAGLLVQYNVRPTETINPWFGAGFGYEIGGSSGTNERNSISNSIRGFELAHLLGGVDFRLQDYFGIGPFVDGALGRYDVAESRTNAGGLVTSRGGTIDDKGVHLWLILGVRAVVMP